MTVYVTISVTVAMTINVAFDVTVKETFYDNDCICQYCAYDREGVFMFATMTIVFFNCDCGYDNNSGHDCECGCR